MKNIPFQFNEKDNDDLYGEELNYYIDTISNIKETHINNTDKSSETTNNFNNLDFIPISKEKNKKIRNEKNKHKNMNSKDKYIKSLEKKLVQQEEQISKLMDYKNQCETKIKEMNPLISFPFQNDNDIDISYNNDEDDDDYIINKNKKNPKRINLSFNQNINPKKSKNIPVKFNKANSELNINNITNTDGDKYDKLYSKYIKVMNDLKNLSNNSVSTNEYTRLKTQYNELKNKNNNLLKQIQKEKSKANTDNNENEIIKNLKEQVQTFREELVLSQAMVNSLRAELEQYNKNNKINKNNKNNIGNFDNYKNDINYNDNDNNENRQYNNVPNNRGGGSNNQLREEIENLKMSLKNNSLLLSKVLEENNRLREKNFGEPYQNYNNANKDNINQNNNDDIMILKNNLIQYENKFDYFNDYINNIKNKINEIYNNLKSILYKYENDNNFSDNFNKKIKDLKDEMQKIKKIDRYNLDSADDEEVLKLYMNLVNLLLDEIGKNNSKKNIININDLKKNVSDDNINKHLIEILEIIKEISSESGIKQLISDALKILNNLSNLYQIRNSNNLNGSNNINEKILEQERELEYIKKLLICQKNNGGNKQLTYTMNYYSPKIESKRNKNGYYFTYE